VLAFQIPVDGWLTKLSAPVVEYSSRQVTGLRGPWDIPVEDFLFGFALVTAALLLWERQGAEPQERAQGRPSGNWFVLGARRDVRRDHAHGVTVAGTELLAWRDREGRLAVGPRACPHLGAPLSRAAVDCGELVCRWHGLRLSARDGRWRALPAYDDGVLAWVRLDTAGGEPSLQAPVLSARPQLSQSMHAVATLIGVCEPEDIVANRLAPWDGAWFEAVTAHSSRPGFALARRAAPALRPAIRRAAARLWRDDLTYAERRYWLRSA
jgi:nitrite reductase/ring-hydroxylating ferredoxin subunit